MRTGFVTLSLVCASLPLFSSTETAKRDITVKDMIETTRWADVDYFWGANPDHGVALYAPDGEHFVIALRKGDLTNNANEYSIYLFPTNSVFRSSQPRLLFKMASRSNSPAIRGIKWLSDSRTIAFVGEQGSELPQVYTVNTQTAHLMERTHHRTGVDQFDISPDGKKILFTASEGQTLSLTPEQHLHGIVIENQDLEDILAGRFNEKFGEEALFFEERKEEEVAFPSTHQINLSSRLSFSPDGRYACVKANFRSTNPAWVAYNNQALQFWGKTPPPLGGASPIAQYFLFDCLSRAIRPLLDAPAIYSASTYWAQDSHALYLKTFLPIAGISAVERSERVEAELPVEISIPALAMNRLSMAEWRQFLQDEGRELPAITLRESPNMPPKVFARNKQTGRNVEIMDLNPQFSELNFGQVEELHFVVHGVPIIAGLYLPPDYVAGNRYPLVVQTHGYDPKRFSMDGRNEWTSGFAARALAAAGIIVVQMQQFENPADHDRIGNDRTLGRTLEESSRNFVVSCYEKVVQELNDRKMIDPDRVGISGFSRTVWFVAYILTHSETPRFRTATLTDGIDGGYFEYIAGRSDEFADDNGGDLPFGRDGLAMWLQESPSFNLDRVCLPIRLVSIVDRLSQWEWFVAGKLQKKPVELIEIPDGSHMLEKPSDRYIAMQGIVDWFRFWLQDYIDPIPGKQAQYSRWRALRGLESKESSASCPK
jgi:dipeptidyl aminopeptidase/acylaminoacyl peptidase